MQGTTTFKLLQLNWIEKPLNQLCSGSPQAVCLTPDTIRYAFIMFIYISVLTLLHTSRMLQGWSITQSHPLQAAFYLPATGAFRIFSRFSLLPQLPLSLHVLNTEMLNRYFYLNSHLFAWCNANNSRPLPESSTSLCVATQNSKIRCQIRMKGKKEKEKHQDGHRDQMACRQ